MFGLSLLGFFYKSENEFPASETYVKDCWVLLTKCGSKRFLLTKCGPYNVSVDPAYFVGIIIIT